MKHASIGKNVGKICHDLEADGRVNEESAVSEHDASVLGANRRAPQGQCVCAGFTVRDVCCKGLKFGSKNYIYKKKTCISGEHHLDARSGVDTQSLNLWHTLERRCCRVLERDL